MPKVQLTLDQDSVTALTDGGFSLYALMAVKSSDRAGRPLLWQRWTQLAPNMTVGWTNTLDAYTSTSPIQAWEQIAVGCSVGIQVGQTFEVEKAGGCGPVMSQGSKGAVTILNCLSVQYTCGICRESSASESAPVCAFPVYPGFAEVITPLEKVLLTFSTSRLQPGTVIEDSLSQVLSIHAPRMASLLATSPGVLIDCTGADERDLRFSVAGGWDWGGAAWGHSVSAVADVVPLLIVTGE